MIKDIHDKFDDFIGDYLKTLDEMNKKNWKKKGDEAEEFIYQFHLELDKYLNKERIKILNKEVKNNERRC